MTQEPLAHRRWDLRDFGWLLALRFFLIVVGPPLLAGEVSLYLFPRFEPLVAYFLALFSGFCLWGWLEDRR